MEQKQTFFSKVSTRKERERAFVLLTDTKTDIECQLPNKSIVKLTPDKLKDSYMVVHTNEPVVLNQEVILTFNIGQEKYFMKSTIDSHDLQHHYLLRLDPALFKLQRRNSFRVQIPQGYLAKLNLTQINQQKVQKKFPLFDLSGGGFAFEISSNKDFEISKDQILYGEIEVGGKFKRNFVALVRHVINVGSQGSGIRKVGAEFTNMPQTEQQDFINVVMEIHRDMFSKFKIGTR